MKADMWMPLYIADYLADTMRLSTEQHGAYLLLLMDYWRSGPLPDNDQVLASIARLSIDRWGETRGLLVGFFSVIDGFWVHKRVDVEMAKAIAFRERQKANGSKGGRPKQPKENPWVNPRGNPEETPSPSPTPTHKEQEKAGAAGAPQNRGSRLAVDWSLPNDWRAEATDSGVPAGSIDLEARKFRDYWCAKTGKDATKLDWLATWRNWCRNAAERTYRRTEKARQAGQGRHDLTMMDYDKGVTADGKF